MRSRCQIQTAADLAALAVCKLPTPFHTGHLATGLDVSRPVAQRIAYCLRQTGAATVVGKLVQPWKLYAWATATEDAAA